MSKHDEIANKLAKKFGTEYKSDKGIDLVLSDKVKSNWMIVLDKLRLTEGKTKEFLKKLNNLDSASTPGIRFLDKLIAERPNSA